MPPASIASACDVIRRYVAAIEANPHDYYFRLKACAKITYQLVKLTRQPNKTK